MIAVPTGIERLRGGMLLPLAEDLYTIQGEGFHTGRAAYFIRLGGCDVGCVWCDAKFSWNPELFTPVPINDIVARAEACGARTAVITGGEPLLYPLDCLTHLLSEQGIEVFLETSGSHPFSGRFDWVCLSPKRRRPPLDEAFDRADELKVVIENDTDFEWAEQNAARVGADCRLFLQPEWSAAERIMPALVEYVKAHPRWNISLQTHKYMNIP